MKTRLILLLAVAAGALAACDTPTGQWSDVQAPRQLRVDYQRLTHAATFPAGSAQLAQVEKDSVTTFLKSAQVTPDDTVYLEGTTDDKLTNSRVSTLVRDLSRLGYSVSTLPPARDSVPANSLLVVVERYVVTPPDCPNWSKSPTGEPENAVSSNFGCSNMTNLGLMVANPRDLVIGRELGPEDADYATLAIQRYRSGKTAPLPSNSAGTSYTFVPIAPAAASSGTSTGQ